MKKVSKTIILIFAIFVFSTIVFGDNSSFQKYSIWETIPGGVLNYTDNYTPDTNDWPFGYNPKKIGFNLLYGNSKDIVRYRGEIPECEVDSNNKLIHTGSDKIDGQIRPWANESLDIDESSINDSLHLEALANSRNNNRIFYSIGRIFYNLCSFPLNLIISVKNFDLFDLFYIFDSNGTLANSFYNMFLFSPDGTPSAFLTIMIIFAFVSIGANVIRAIKGSDSFKIVSIQMLSVILVFFLAGVSYQNIQPDKNNNNKLGMISTNFANQLSNIIIGSYSGDNYEIYNYETDNSQRDIDEIQKALMLKPIIEKNIESQFGVSIDKLEINAENFGKNYSYAINKTMTGKREDFKVYTSNSDYCNNLGYFFWAANSNVNEKDPFSNTTYNAASTDRILHIIDFLNECKKQAVANEETEVVNNINTIIRNFYSPNYNYAAFNYFVMGILILTEVYALGLITLFLTFGKIIITLSMFVLPILPGLFLSQYTIRTGKNLCKTYFVGFIRLIIGLVLFNIVITIVGLFAKSNTTSMIIGSIVCILIGKGSCRIIMELSRLVGRYESYSLMQQLNSSMINLGSKYSMNSTKRRIENKKYKGVHINENGSWSSKKDYNDSIKKEDEEIIQKGFGSTSDMSTIDELEKVKEDRKQNIGVKIVQTGLNSAMSIPGVHKLITNKLENDDKIRKENDRKNKEEKIKIEKGKAKSEEIIKSNTEENRRKSMEESAKNAVESAKKAEEAIKTTTNFKEKTNKNKVDIVDKNGDIIVSTEVKKNESNNSDTILSEDFDSRKNKTDDFKIITGDEVVSNPTIISLDENLLDDI